MVRNLVSDRRLLRRYVAVEASMEELAPDLGLDASIAGLAGLGLGFDAQLCLHNPERLGEIARELLATEGAPAEVSAAVLAARRDPADALAPLAAGLVITEALVIAAYRELEEPDETLDALTARAVSRLTERATPRAASAARARGLALERCAAHTLTGMRRVRSDLAL